jgi:flagellar capping protein FliD
MNGTDLVSGLDTDSIIQKLVSGTQSKIDRQKQLEQAAEWKQEAYRDIITQLQTFTSTYFSYTNSANNLLSSTFFDITSLVSSSPLVKASGSSDSAQNMVIQSISSLASKASYTSSQRVSNETITSGEIQTEWTKSSVGGKSLKLTYDGATYTIRMGADLQLDSNDPDEDKVQKIVDELNKQIGSTSGLKGNVAFEKTADGKISLKTTDSSKQVSISDYESDSKDTSGKKLLDALGFTANTSGSSITGNAVDTSVDGYLFNKTVDSDSELKLNVNGQTYTLTLGADYDISDGTPDSIAKNIATLLQKQIDADDDLKGKINVSADGGKISFKTDFQDVGISLEGGSRNLLDGLGLSSAVGGAPASEISGTGVDEGALTTSYLADVLSGNSLTFNLDGLSKTISFDESDLKAGEDFSSSTGIVNYLTRKLNNAFGTDSSGKSKVAVSEKDGRLVFQTSDQNSVLSLTSSDSTNVLSTSGALRIGSGESNRTELTKTLDQLSQELNQPLVAGSDGKYTITVNGKEFKFSKTDTLSSVISQINDDKDADVTISYSQTTNSFRVTYDETGSQGKTDIEDAEDGGNLAGVLFGDYSGILSDVLNQQTGVRSAAPEADPGTGRITAPDGDSSYTLSIDGVNSQITIPSGSSYASISELADSIQASIDSDDLKGRVSVGSVNGHLVFNSTDGSRLSVSHVDGTEDFLGISSQSTQLVGDSQTLAELYDSGVKGITANRDGSGNIVSYSFAGIDKTYSGDTTLADMGAVKGTDLHMKVALNGSSTPLDIVRSSNTTTIDGVTLTVSGTTTDGDGNVIDNANITFSADNNVDDLYTKITNFINDYNKIIDTINTKIRETTDKDYPPLTDDQKKDMSESEISAWEDKAKEGVLQNDSSLSNILSDLRNAMTGIVQSTGSSLSSIGISTIALDYTSGGQLTVDTDTLKNALATDPDKVAEMFTGEDGISQRVNDVLNKNVGTFGGDGVLLLIAGSSSRTVDDSELGQQITDYKNQISDLNDELTTEENRYWDQFSAMEQSLSVLMSQSSYLSSMMGSSS